MKGHCDTRWSVKSYAVKAISTQIDEMIVALDVEFERLKQLTGGTIQHY